MAATVAGTRAPLSYCASFRAARMEAAIRSTRLRPSSTRISVSYSLFVRHQWDETENQVEVGGWLDRWNEGADIEGGGKCTRYAGHKGCAKTGNFRSTPDPQLSEFGVVFKDLGGLHMSVSP